MQIVSLAPSATSILCAIGARRLLVGVTKWCCDVAPVAGLPQVGDCWHVESVADIVALRPTLVIGSVPYKQETVGKLLEQRFVFLAMNPRTIEDIYADIRLLGGLTGRPTHADTLIRKMRSEFAALERASKKLKRRLRVYCEAWPNPRISSPPWVAELVRIAGGRMVVPAGARVTGQVGSIVTAKRFALFRGQAAMSLTFRTIEVDHREIPVQMSILSIQDASTQASGKRRKDIRVEEGQVVEARPDIKGSVTAVGLGTAGGTVAGAVFSHVIRGMALGLVGGTVYVMAKKGHPVELPAQTALVVRLDNTITLPMTAARATPYTSGVTR